MACRSRSRTTTTSPGRSRPTARAPTTATPAKEDAEIVRRLRAAGAIPIGKTHLPELAICGFTESATWGVTRNPWNLDRSPAGSSGGSAAAVAAGLASFATASDGAGSIRYPAANCRIFGLKPQRGRVSLMPDAEHWHGLSVAGVHHALRARPGRDPRRDRGPGAGRRRHAAGLGPAARGGRCDVRRRSCASALRTKSPMPGIPVAGALPAQRSTRSPNCCARSGTTSARASPTTACSPPTPSSPGTCTAFARTWSECRARSGSSGARAASDAKARSMGHFVERARDQEAVYAKRIFAAFDEHDVLLMPMTAQPPIEVMRWEGLGATRTVNGMSRVYPFAAVVEHAGKPGRVGACAARRRTACRSRSSSRAVLTTSTRSSRWPPRSKQSGLGPSGRRSPSATARRRAPRCGRRGTKDGRPRGRRCPR